MNQGLAMFDLTGKVAITVGGSGGLGTEVSLGLARAGADVIPMSRNLENNQRLAHEIEALGRRSLGLSVDILDRQQVDQAVGQIMEKFGHIDILVNAAGALAKKPFLEYTEEDWDRVMDTNLKGMFIVSQAVGKIMVEQKAGKIINFASMGSFLGITRSSAYCASKGGVVQLTKVLAGEWGPYGVNVNAIAPGWFKTQLNQHFLGQPEVQAKICGDTPLRRYGKAQDLVGAVVFLASPASDFVTGATLSVDGGYLSLAL